MQIPKPTLILTAGVACTGKDVFIDRFCKTTPDTVFLNKDGLNNAFVHVKPTFSQEQLPSIEDTLRYYKEKGMLTTNAYFNGEQMIRVPWGTDYYGRYVRDQTYLAFAQMARDNLQLGKSPVIQAIVYRQVHDRTLPGFMATFRDFPIALLHFTTDEKVLRQRLIERTEKDSYSRERDLSKFKDDKAWQEERRKQPVLWDELQYYDHHVVDNSNKEGKPLEQSVQELVEQAEPYILRRATQRDELLYRVNEQGQVLGGVHYSKAHSRDAKEGIRHLAANIFIFKTYDREQLLLQKRGAMVVKPDAWGVPGGQVLYEAPSDKDLETALQDLGIQNILEISGNKEEAEEKRKQVTIRVLESSDARAPYESIKREISEEVFNNQPLPKQMEFREVYKSSKQAKSWDRELEVMYEAIYPGPFAPGEESAEVKFFDVQELRRDIKDNPEKYASSLGIQLNKFPFS